MCDGAVEANQTVPASPFTITFGSAASSSFQVGLDYTVQAKTMPTEPTLQSGSVQGVKKRVVQSMLCKTKQSLTINGKQISFRSFGVECDTQSRLSQD